MTWEGINIFLAQFEKANLGLDKKLFRIFTAGGSSSTRN